ncbi:MAG: LysR family transcriptional regulator [Oscillospiraceae bacterium]|nr:LysR family transcriptional regulator [Oscillospiraceae bacterium]
MTLLQMNYLLEIDRCGSMNKAAQSLFVSQSTLSNALAELERELGITVFHRSNRGIAPTEEGRELLGQIAPIVEQSRELSRYYSRRSEAETARLSIAAQRYPFCAKAFVELLREQEKPCWQMSFKETDMAAVIREVAEGMSDLGVIFLSDRTERAILRSLNEKNLVFTPLVTLRPQVFLRRGHPLAGLPSVTPEQLRPYPQVVFTRSGGDLRFAEEALAGTGADFERLITVNDRATVYNVIAHTDAVSTGSGLLPEGYADASLTAVPLEGCRDMRLGAIHQRRPLSAAEKRFLQLLRAACA